MMFPWIPSISRISQPRLMTPNAYRRRKRHGTSGWSRWDRWHPSPGDPKCDPCQVDESSLMVDTTVYHWNRGISVWKTIYWDLGWFRYLDVPFRCRIRLHIIRVVGQINTYTHYRSLQITVILPKIINRSILIHLDPSHHPIPSQQFSS